MHPGDTVLFTPIGPHTITFNPPPLPVFAFFGPTPTATLDAPGTFVNSGFVADPTKPFSLFIGSGLPAGVYKYFCKLHFGMSGKIDVRPAGAALPMTDAEYSTIAQDQIARDLARAAAIAAAPFAQASSADEDEQGDRQNQDETDEDVDHAGPTVLAGAGDKRVTNLRFFPRTIKIKTGQTITFEKRDPTEPHTVTFGTTTIAPPEAEPFPSGPPPYSYGGTGILHSGFLLTPQQADFYKVPGLTSRTRIRITFTTPGTFTYVCTVHDEIGMLGTVIVEP